MNPPDYPTRAFLYCPGCGQQNGSSPSPKHFHCPDCDFVFYTNAAGAVSALIVNEAGEFLWVQRARDPQRGKWNVPGGFVDPFESAEEALTRETREEVGLKIVEPTLLASFPNLYQYRNVTYHTLDFFFLCRTENVETLTLEASEISAVRWLDPALIDPEEIAFASTKKALEKYLAQNHSQKQEIGFQKEK